MVSRRLFVSQLIQSVALSSSAVGQGGKGGLAPESAVRELLAAMEANDAARIRAVFAPSASQAYGNGAPKTGAAFSRWLQSDIIDRQGKVANPSVIATGSEVVMTGQFSNNAGYRSAANFLFKVSDGRIVSWQMRY